MRPLKYIQNFCKSYNNFEFKSSLKIQKINLEKQQNDVIPQKTNIKVQENQEIYENQNIILKNLNKIEQKHRFFQDLNSDQFTKVFQNDKNYYLSNVSKFILLHNMMRKFKKFKVYQRPEIIKSLYFISENLNSIQQEHVSAFAMNLYKMKILDQILYQKLIVYVQENQVNLTLFSICNIVYSISNFPIQNEQILDINKVFRDLEVVIAIKFADQIKKQEKFDSKSFCQILQAFSRTQIFSEEFKYFLKKTLEDQWNSFSPSEISNCCYMLQKNKIEFQSIQEKLSDSIKNQSQNYNIKEISLCLYALKDTPVLDNKILSVFQRNFILKSEHCNIQDISLFIEVFFQKKYVTKEFYEKMTDLLGVLRGNIDSQSIIKLFHNFSELHNLQLVQNKYFFIIKGALERLLKKKEIPANQIKIFRQNFKDINDKSIKESLYKTLDSAN